MSTATPALLRVKRRKCEDPKDVLILSAKKRKANDSESGEEKIKVLKLAGTLNADDTKVKDELSKTVTKILAKKNYPNFEELKEKYKKSVSGSTKEKSKQKVKSEISSHREDSKFRLVAQKRSLKLEELEDWPSQDDEKSDNCASSSDSPEKELFHIYDVISDTGTEDEEKKKKEKPVPEKISCNGVEMVREFVDTKK